MNHTSNVGLYCLSVAPQKISEGKPRKVSAGEAQLLRSLSKLNLQRRRSGTSNDPSTLSLARRLSGSSSSTSEMPPPSAVPPRTSFSELGPPSLGRSYSGDIPRSVRRHFEESLQHFFPPTPRGSVAIEMAALDDQMVMRF